MIRCGSALTPSAAHYGRATRRSSRVSVQIVRALSRSTRRLRVVAPKPAAPGAALRRRSPCSRSRGDDAGLPPRPGARRPRNDPRGGTPCATTPARPSGSPSRSRTSSFTSTRWSPSSCSARVSPSVVPPLWSGAPARVILADRGDDEIRRVLETRSHTELEPVNPPDPQQFLADVHEVRRTGHSRALEETVPGVHNVRAGARGRRPARRRPVGDRRRPCGCRSRRWMCCCLAC